MKISKDEDILAQTLEDSLSEYYPLAEGFEKEFKRHISAYTLHLINAHSKLEDYVKQSQYIQATPYLVEIAETLGTLQYTLPVFGFNPLQADRILGEIYAVIIDGSLAVIELQDYIDKVPLNPEEDA